MTSVTDKAGETIDDPAAFVPTAPSKMPNAQGPAPKPGEPLGVTMRTGPTVGKPDPKAEHRVSPGIPPKKP
jgi:hypothetical protein